MSKSDRECKLTQVQILQKLYLSREPELMYFGIFHQWTWWAEIIKSAVTLLLLSSLCEPSKSLPSVSPPRPGRDLVRVRSPGTPLVCLSLPLKLVLSTAFMFSCSAASSEWLRPWGCWLSWLPLGALLELLRPHWRGQTEWREIWNRQQSFLKSQQYSTFFYSIDLDAADNNYFHC